MLRIATQRWWRNMLGEPEPITRVDDEVLETVAVLYDTAHAVGLPEVDSIAEYYGRPKPTAATWLREARERRAHKEATS